MNGAETPDPLHVTEARLRACLTDLYSQLGQTRTVDAALEIADIVKPYVIGFCDVQSLARTRAMSLIDKEPADVKGR